MEKILDGKEVINGTFGETWFDNDYLSQVIALKAEITIKKTAIARVKSLVPSQKVTGIEYKGEMKLHHINSNIAKKVSAALKEGKNPTFTVISYLHDPDSSEAERVALYGVSLDKINIIDWENGKLGEESYSFTFEDYEYL